MQIEKVIQVIFLAVLLILALTVFISIPNLSEDLLDEHDEPRPFCAVISFNGDAEYGKTLFKNHCASCHAKDMRTPATGPPLQHSTDYWKNDTLQFLAFLNDTELYIANHRNTRIDSLIKDYGSHKNNLTLVELRALIAYINL